MNAPVTRRALLGASTATIGAVVLPTVALACVAALPAVDPDATLFELLARHADLSRAWGDATDAYGAASERAVMAYPTRPEALTETLLDLGHELVSSGRDRRPDGRPCRFFDLDDVERLRAAGPMLSRAWEYDGIPLPSVPNLTSEARRQEIVAAADAWLADCQAVEDEVGFTAAIAAEDAAACAAEDIAAAIENGAPQSQAGLRAKARWIMGQRSPEEAAMALVRQLAGDVASVGAERRAAGLVAA